jgi:hypothetical protein
MKPIPGSRATSFHDRHKFKTLPTSTQGSMHDLRAREMRRN